MIRKTTILLVAVLALAFLGFAVSASALPKDGKKPAIHPGIQPGEAPPPAEAVQQLPVVFDEEALFENPVRFPISSVPARSLGISPVSAATAPFHEIVVGTNETPGGNNRMRRQIAVTSNGRFHIMYRARGKDVTDFFDSTNLWSVPYYYNAKNCEGPDSISFADPYAVPLKTIYPPAFDTLLRPRWIGNLGGIIETADKPVAYGEWYRQGGTSGTNPLSFLRVGSSQAKATGVCSYDMVVDSAPFARFGNGVATPATRIQGVMEKTSDLNWVATARAGAPFAVYSTRTSDGGNSWSPMTAIAGFASAWFNSVDICGNGNLVYIFSHTDPANLQAFQTTEHPCYVRSTDGGATWGAINEVTGVQHRKGYLANMLRINAIMIGDTAHVIWSDWNNWKGEGFAGVGSHIWHAAVRPNNTIKGPHLVANVNIDGREPDNGATLFGLATGFGGDVSLCYRPAAFGKGAVLYAFWAHSPDNGNFGFADSTNAGLAHLAVMDIFCSASNNNGDSWDEPQNVTQTNSPGCNGTSVLCADEFYYSTPQRVWVGTADTTQWKVGIFALVRAFPGLQESAALSGIAPDGGPFTVNSDRYRLYQMLARDPVASVRGDLGPAPTETTALHAVHLLPGVATDVVVQLSLANIGLTGYFVDSAKLDASLSTNGLVVTPTNLHVGEFLGTATSFDNITLTFDRELALQGLRTGFLTYYVSGGAEEKVIKAEIRAYAVPTFCINNLAIIASGTNYSFVGNQGSVSDQSGIGMFNEASGLTLFYDGGVWVYNPVLNAPNSAAGTPRRVTRQIFQDKFLRCGSTTEEGFNLGSGYQNNWLKTISTDTDDSSLIFVNVWEQSTHPDSSEFLMQTVKVINTSAADIANVAMGVLYDIDVYDIDTPPPAGAEPAGNQSGDTLFLAGDGRYYQLGWQSGENFITTFGDNGCGPNNQFYGAVFIPGSTGNSGDTIGPAGAVFYRQRGFSYNIDNQNSIGGDTLAQRYSKFVVGMHSTENPADDSLTGVTGDTINGDRCTPTNRAASDDEGYMAIVKRATVPKNDSVAGLVARYGFEGAAASIDPGFAGPGVTYTVLHLSAANGIGELINNANKAVNWYNNHAQSELGGGFDLRGDLNWNGVLDPPDISRLLLYTFTGQLFHAYQAGTRFVGPCVADPDHNGIGGQPPDISVLLLGTFVGTGCPWCLKPCPL